MRLVERQGMERGIVDGWVRDVEATAAAGAGPAENNGPLLGTLKRCPSGSTAGEKRWG
jgi:hypothetical protein